MSGFVDEARREWKRLGVPDLAADEMADDLRADIEEAERDGASAADLLGASVNDPRGFAAAWASERGLVPLGRERRRLGRRWWIAAAVLAVAAVAIIGVLTAHVTKSRKIIITRAGHAPLANQIQQLAAQQQQSRIIGTEVYSVLLLPGNVKLSEDTVPKRVGRPSEIAVLVKNTGGSPLAQVHVLLRLGAAYTASGETGPLRPSFVRYVRFRIPRTLVLSADLLIGASTLPVPGERNLSNNRRIWHVRLRP